MLFNLNFLLPSVINIIGINTVSARVYPYTYMYNVTYIKHDSKFEFQRLHETRNHFNRDIDRDFDSICSRYPGKDLHLH